MPMAGLSSRLHPGISLAQWHEIVDQWHGLYPDRPLPRVRYWVILNTWIRPPKQAVARQWPTVAARSVQVMMAANVHYPLDRIESACQYLRDAYGMDAQMHWTGIPADYTVPESKHAFDPVVTNFLADTGEVQGADPLTWRASRLHLHNPFLNADGEILEEGWEHLPEQRETIPEKPAEVIRAAGQADGQASQNE